VDHTTKAKGVGMVHQNMVLVVLVLVVVLLRMQGEIVEKPSHCHQATGLLPEENAI
jgi:hypothetical protein